MRISLMRTALERYFVFVFFGTVVLPTVIIGSLDGLGELLAQITKQPVDQILNLLGLITAPQSGFYVSLLIQSTFIGSGLNLLRIWPLLMRWITRRSTGIDDEIQFVYPFWYDGVYGGMLRMLTITVFFCVTMPITCPFGLMYMLMQYIQHRFGLNYYYPKIGYGGGASGAMFSTALGFFMWIQLLFQIATVSMFVSKSAVPQAIISLCVVAQLYYRQRIVRRRMTQIFRADTWLSASELEDSEQAEAMWLDQDESLTPQTGPSRPSISTTKDFGNLASRTTLENQDMMAGRLGAIMTVFSPGTVATQNLTAMTQTAYSIQGLQSRTSLTKDITMEMSAIRQTSSSHEGRGSLPIPEFGGVDVPAVPKVPRTVSRGSAPVIYEGAVSGPMLAKSSSNGTSGKKRGDTSAAAAAADHNPVQISPD